MTPPTPRRTAWSCAPRAPAAARRRSEMVTPPTVRATPPAPPVPPIRPAPQPRVPPAVTLPPPSCSHAPPPFLAGYMHFKVQTECQAADSTYYDNSGGCSSISGVVDFTTLAETKADSTCYMRVFPSPSLPPSPPPSPPPPSPPPSPSPPPPSPPPMSPAPVYQALDPSGYKCQGWYVQKYDYNSPGYSAADCQALCTQSADCGATTFQNMGSAYYDKICARDTACPTCFSLSAPPHSRASGRHSPTAQLPTRAAPLPGRLHALQGPDRVPGGHKLRLRRQRLLFQLGGCI